MHKIGFIFPGQGVQTPGMARDFYEQYECSRKIMDTACETTGLNLRSICFEENEKLNQTEYTQIALLTAELMVLAAVQEQGFCPSVTAGQSLGEYAALTAAGCFQLPDVLRVVRQRGILMQNAVPIGQGAMVAIVGLTSDQIEEICRQAGGSVQISNYNSEKQSVISGERNAVMRAKALADQARARLTLELDVSVPSHSPLMREAAESLEKILDPLEIKDPSIPCISNVLAQPIRSKSEVKQLLKKQLYHAVCWKQSIESMIQQGTDLFVEIGPGQTLTRLNKKINSSIQSVSISTAEDLKNLVL